MSTAAKQLRGRAARIARLMPAGPSTAARTPFVLLVVVLLGGGLITLLMLNSSLNEGSFELSELKLETTELTDEQQALQRDVDSYSAPDALERRARELGMVPGGPPAFVKPDGGVEGVPRKATAPPAPEPTSSGASASASDAASAADAADAAGPSGAAAPSTGQPGSPGPSPSSGPTGPAASTQPTGPTGPTSPSRASARSDSSAATGSGPSDPSAKPTPTSSGR
ncbi:FtsB family cell division protein [Streptomyces sp. NPDC004726]